MIIFIPFFLSFILYPLFFIICRHPLLHRFKLEQYSDMMFLILLFFLFLPIYLTEQDMMFEIFVNRFLFGLYIYFGPSSAHFILPKVCNIMARQRSVRFRVLSNKIVSREFSDLFRRQKFDEELLEKLKKNMITIAAVLPVDNIEPVIITESGDRTWWLNVLSGIILQLEDLLHEVAKSESKFKINTTLIRVWSYCYNLTFGIFFKKHRPSASLEKGIEDQMVEIIKEMENLARIMVMQASTTGEPYQPNPFIRAFGSSITIRALARAVRPGVRDFRLHACIKALKKISLYARMISLYARRLQLLFSSSVVASYRNPGKTQEAAIRGRVKRRRVIKLMKDKSNKEMVIDFPVSEDIFDKSELIPMPAEMSIGSTSLQESFQIPPVQFSVAQVFPSHNISTRVASMAGLENKKDLEEPSIVFFKVISLVTFNFMMLVGLSNCNNCSQLPPFGQLPFLKYLNIEGLNRVEKVGFELFGTIYSSTQPFLSLQILTFRRMLEWQEWIFPEVEGGEFPHLQQLCIHRCPKLKRSLPRSLPPSTENFEISECPSLETRFPRLPSENFFWFHDGNRMLLRGFDKPMDRPPGLPDSNVVQHKSDDEMVSELSSTDVSITSLSTPPETSKISNEDSSIKHEGASEIPLKMTESSSHTDDPINIWYSQISSLESLKVSEISQLLKLPPRLRTLKIEGCDALKSLPEDLMLNNIHLQQLYIIDCCFLESFSVDHLPTTLKSLYIRNCRKLKFPSPSDTKQHALLEHLCIGSSCDSLSSFHLSLFPELRSLAIWDCVNFSSFSTSKNHMSLDALEIRDCPKLLSFLEEGLHTPNLTSIFLSNCKNLKGITKPMDKLISLWSFFINGCPELSSLINGCFPENLSSLCITYCHKLTPSIQWKMNELNNLSCFEIEGGCLDLKSFPEQNLLPSSLNSLRISRLSNLEFLDYKGLERLTSLETLKINGCDKLQSFPEEGLPSSVTYLYINECSLLKARFQNRRGKEWYKIAHVRHIQIDEEVIS